MNTLGLNSSLKPQDATSERAAEFLGKRRFWDWGDADQAELDAWLAESVLHEVAWLRLQGIAASTDRLAALHAFERKRVPPSAGGRFNFNCHQFVLPLLAAASIAAVALWGAPLAVALVASWLAPPDRVDSTDVGGRTLVSFADHTQIELNTNTTIRTRMTTAERTVWLEKGEAWFHVAHDAAHPFTVIVGAHRITDLGTEFLVRRGANDVDVTLLKGRASLSADGAQSATLTPGEEAVATSASLLVARKTSQQLADKLAWRRGVLVFHDTRLADVVREFNRYNTVKLVIADPSIADRRFNGEVEADGLEDFLNFAQVAMRLRADRQGNSILLSRVMPEKTKK